MITPKQFYTKFTAEKLAERKKASHTKKELAYTKKFINKKEKILDLGCGYGRLTIPLAKQGFNTEGIDITPALIKKAKQDAKKEKVSIQFKIGDMRKLPYKKESFDTIICMWTVFMELTKKSDQLKAVEEMLRVLGKNGKAILEMAPPIKSFKPIEYKNIGDKFTHNKKTRISKSTIAGMKAHDSYRHNKKTLTGLMKKAKIKKYRVFVDKFGGRDRLMVLFWKK